MPERTRPNQICPYLGLVGDPDSRFSYPGTAHHCFALKPEIAIPLEHQTAFCFDQKHPTCSRFVERFNSRNDEASPVQPPDVSQDQQSQGLSAWRLMVWGLAVVLFASMATYSVILFIQQDSAPEPIVQAEVQFTETPPPSRTPAAARTPALEFEGEISKPASTPLPFLPTPTAAITPVPEGRIFALSPAEENIGWVVSSEERGNHFGDSFLYAGLFEGEVYHSAFQFDLNQIPRGAPIHQAILQLTGLRDDRLGEDGTWLLRLIEPPVELNWSRSNYQDIFNASTLYTLEPILGEEDVAVGRPNIFELSPAIIRWLEEEIIDKEEPVVSFRLDGPLTGSDNLFAWDAGYGFKSEDNKVTLILNVGPPPETPPLYDYIVITSTPTPENMVTAAAVALQMTADAAEFGPATPLPPNMVTPTPIPDYLIITPTPTPGNEATAQTLVLLATAFTTLDGTPTPFPTNAVTATPLPSATPTPTYVIITSTPTPPSLFEVATTIAAVQKAGLPTPFPENWVTPIVVTSTPTPANKETAQAAAIMATAQALTTGTATPTPGNVQTATPTPIFDLIEPILSPTPTFIPLPTPETIPEQLLGKIIFLSDREEASEGEQFRAYVFDPKTGQLGRLTALWPYEMAKARDVWSADRRFRAFTKDMIRYKSGDEEAAAIREDVPAVYWYDSFYNAEEQLTNFGAGIAYGGVWSPTKEQIAFVSNDSGDDEIWIANRDGSGLRQLTSENTTYNAREIGKDSFIPEINKRPSFSPDGRQIVFYSTRSGNYQLWIMNTDGSEQHLLMDWTPYNDWDPVWVKYLDPPPPLEE